MTTTKAGGRVVSRIVVIHTDEGRLILQIKQVVNTPMLTVVDSAGNEFVVNADDYDKASVTECAQFYAARAEAILAKAVMWN